MREGAFVRGRPLCFPPSSPGELATVKSTLAGLLGRHRRYRELEGLHEISQAFAAMTDIQETYGRLTRRIAELIGAGKCVISLYDPVTREMVGQAPGYGVPDAIIRTFCYRVDTLRMAWNFRLQGVMVKNHPDDFHPTQREYLRPFDVNNVTVVPLVLEGRIIGMNGTVSEASSRLGTPWSFRCSRRAHASVTVRGSSMSGGVP